MRNFIFARRLIPAVIAVGVLLVAVLVALALLTSRHTRTDADHAAPSPAPSSSPVPVPSGAVTLVHGTRLADGIEVGFPHSTVGAISAASQYLDAIASTLDPDYAASLARTAGDPATKAMASDLAKSAVGLRAALQLPASGPLSPPTAFLTTAQMYQLRDTGADRVTVLLLTSDTFINARGGSAQTTGVFPMHMHWTGGDWKLTAIGGAHEDYSGLEASLDTQDAVNQGWQPLIAAAGERAVIPAVALAPAKGGGGCLNGHVAQCFKDVVTLPGKAVSAGLDATGSVVNGVVGDVASSAWDSICHSFADAFTQVLQWFGKVFVSMPDPDLGSIRGVYAITLTLGMTVALVLLVLQAAAVLWTRSGAPLAQALTGVAKAALASLLTLAVAAQLMKTSDQLAAWITTSSGTSMNKFSARLTTLLALSSASGPAIPAVLLLLFGLLGIVVVLVLWFELVLRNAVFTVIVATAPIAAAGQIGSATQDWWRKLVKAGLQLALLKPVIALVFVVGFDMTGDASGITGLISGMAVLFMAVFAWPAVARFFTFTGAAMGGAMGVGALVGAVANRSASGGAGIDPAAFGQFSERQAMAANAARAGTGSSVAGGGSGGSGASGGAGAAGSGAAGASVGAAAGPATIGVAALQALHKTVNAVASRMEQQAGHAGMEGANPTAYPAGYPSYGSVHLPRRSTGASGSSPPDPRPGPPTTPPGPTSTASASTTGATHGKA